MIAEADVVIVVLDVGAGISQRIWIFAMLAGKKTIVLVNKEDLPEKQLLPGAGRNVRRRPMIVVR